MLNPKSRRLVDTREAARILGLNPQTLVNWRSASFDGPPFIKLGLRAVRYDLDELNHWLEEQSCPSGGSR